MASKPSGLKAPVKRNIPAPASGATRKMIRQNSDSLLPLKTSCHVLVRPGSQSFCRSPIKCRMNCSDKTSNVSNRDKSYTLVVNMDDHHSKTESTITTHFAAHSDAQDSQSQQAVDDYVIGDRVWVGGTKAGIIAFIGETQFAPGEWCGVVLDELVGKNDGSVAGVRYFQCEDKRGVFSRLTKLTRHPAERGNVAAVTSIPPTPRPAVSAVKGKATSASVKTPAAMKKANNMDPLKLGDRVIIGGTKTGTLRFTGTTEFAQGEWAGVELDEEIGKNDGSVAGKRYFDCKPKFGLFAPLHKVQRLMPGATPMKTPSKAVGGVHRASLSTPSSNLRRDRSGSQDSVSSMSSAKSSTSTSMSRVSTKASPKGTARPSTVNLAATTMALQDTLKEKEQHIEQLLKERDLERQEVTRAAALLDEAEQRLSDLKLENQRHQDETEAEVQKIKDEKIEVELQRGNLKMQLDEERRKVDDLQFRLEEQSITAGDLEAMTVSADRVSELEKHLEAQKILNVELTGNLASVQEQFERERRKSEDSHSLLDQIEELTHQLSQAEKQIQALSTKQNESETETSQMSQKLEATTQRITDLELQLLNSESQCKQSEEMLAKQKSEIESLQKSESEQKQIFLELQEKLNSKISALSATESELVQMKSQTSDLQRAQVAAQEKVQSLTDDKAKLEKNISGMLQNSGDSAKQLTALNEQLLEKERKIEERTEYISQVEQRLQKQQEDGKLKEEQAIQTLQQEQNKHQCEMEQLHSALEQAQTDMSSAVAKATQYAEQQKQQTEEILKMKDSEIAKLSATINENLSVLAARDSEKRELQTQLSDAGQALENIKKQLLESEHTTQQLQASSSQQAQQRDHEIAELRQEIATWEQRFNETEKQLTDVNHQLESSKSHSVEEIAAKTKEFDALKQELEITQQEVNQVKEKFDVTLRDLQGTVEKQAADKVAREKLESRCKDLDTELERVRLDLDSAIKQKEQLVSETLSDSEHIQQQIKEERDRLSTEKDQLHHQLEEATIAKDEEILNMKKHLRETNELNESKQKELVAKNAELLFKIQEVTDKLSISSKQSNELQTLLTSSQQEATRLATELTNERNMNKQSAKEIESKLRSQIDEMRQRDSELTMKYESERLASQQQLETTQIMLGERDEEIQQTIKQVQLLRNEKENLQSLLTAAHQVESEKNALEEKLVEAQELIAVAEAKASVAKSQLTGDPLIAKLNEEKEFAEQQVSFLNSVIVELQRKNEDLSARLQIMETHGHYMSDEITNGEVTTAPRLYCDICECFDVHDTEDCPTQAMSEDPEPSRHHGQRGEQRSYCDTCEVFGHWTEDCQDDETF